MTIGGAELCALVAAWHSWNAGRCAGARSLLLVTMTIVTTLARFAGHSETIKMMNLLGVVESTTLQANDPMTRPEVRSAAELVIASRYRPMIRDDSFWQAGIVRSLAPEYRPLAEDILKRHPDVSAAQLAEADKTLSAARDEQERLRGSPRKERSIIELSGVIISTVTALALALVLVVCAISSLLVPGGLVSRNLGLAAVTRSGREISRVRSLARVLTAGLPGIVWFVYLAFSPQSTGLRAGADEADHGHHPDAECAGDRLCVDGRTPHSRAARRADRNMGGSALNR